MKLHNPMIIVPWFDSDGMKQRSHMVFKGTVDRRRLHREVRRFINTNFGSTPAGYIKSLVLANCRAFQKLSDARAVTSTVTDALVEEWIKRIKDDTDENESDSTGQGSVPEEATVHLPIVSEGSSDDVSREHLSGS